MDAKLTLKLDQQIIEQAKRFASGRQLSLSRLIEHYLRSLVSTSSEDPIDISPFVRSMSEKIEIPAAYDYRSDYRASLDNKHA